MVAYAGRQVTFVWDGDIVPGIREKGLTINGDPIDVGSDEDNGQRALLANITAETKIDISLSGVTKSNRLRAAMVNGPITATVTMTWPNGDVLTGPFNLTSYDEKAPFRDAITFDAKLSNQGLCTYTAA